MNTAMYACTFRHNSWNAWSNYNQIWYTRGQRQKNGKFYTLNKFHSIKPPLSPFPIHLNKILKKFFTLADQTKMKL